MSNDNSQAIEEYSFKIQKSNEGLVLLTDAMLMQIKLSHIASGLDEEPRTETRESNASLTTITGYTEWFSGTSIRISIGWDWYLGVVDGKCTFKRINPPRSNVMLVDSSGNQMGRKKSNMSLIRKIDECQWQNRVRECIN